MLLNQFESIHCILVDRSSFDLERILEGCLRLAPLLLLVVKVLHLFVNVVLLADFSSQLEP